MDSNKIETVLNLSLDLSEEEREKTNINSGIFEENVWQLIIRYSGDLKNIAIELDFSFVELLGGYAVIWIRKNLIVELEKYNSILYIELPKNFYYDAISIEQGCIQSCLAGTIELNLDGEGVLVAILDSGIDVTLDDFNENGKTKIYRIWDQTIYGKPPYEYLIGYEFDSIEINEFINNEKNKIISRDISGHGTAIASIIRECVPNVTMLIIKLGNINGVTNTAYIMMGIDYAIRVAYELGYPIIFNLSYGNNYGDHEGNSVLEKYIDFVSNITKSSFIVGSGNEGDTNRHARINVTKTNENVYFSVPSKQTAFNIQIWKKYTTNVDFYLITPENIRVGPINRNANLYKYNFKEYTVYVINSLPSPININEEIFISFIPAEEYITQGIYTIETNNKDIYLDKIDMWLPVAASTSANVRFINSSTDTTLTIPSTARNVITVAAYNSNTFSYAAFSGRGYTRDLQIKPDIAAPGVDIIVPSINGGYIKVSGTSFATPYVSAAAIKLMQWGIVKNNDPFMYGERLKARLISLAEEIYGENIYPNNRVGWGRLCLKNV